MPELKGQGQENLNVISTSRTADHTDKSWLRNKQTKIKKLIYSSINAKYKVNFEFIIHYELRASLHRHRHIMQMSTNGISNSNFARISR